MYSNGKFVPSPLQFFQNFPTLERRPRKAPQKCCNMKYVNFQNIKLKAKFQLKRRWLLLEPCLPFLFWNDII